MDFLFIFKYVGLAFGSAIIILTAYYLTKKIALSVLGSGGMYDSIWGLIFQIIGSSFLASGWLCAVESWDMVAVLFIVIVIPALLGLWGAVDTRKQKAKQAAKDKYHLELKNQQGL